MDRYISWDELDTLRVKAKEFQFNLQIHSMRGEYQMEHLDRDAVEEKFYELLEMLAETKPNDRSEKDRAFAIVKTEIEKAYAYYKTFAVWE